MTPIARHQQEPGMNAARTTPVTGPVDCARIPHPARIPWPPLAAQLVPRFTPVSRAASPGVVGIPVGPAPRRMPFPKPGAPRGPRFGPVPGDAVGVGASVQGSLRCQEPVTPRIPRFGPVAHGVMPEAPAAAATARGGHAWSTGASSTGPSGAPQVPFRHGGGISLFSDARKVHAFARELLGRRIGARPTTIRVVVRIAIAPEADLPVPADPGGIMSWLGAWASWIAALAAGARIPVRAAVAAVGRHRPRGMTASVRAVKDRSAGSAAQAVLRMASW